jgi:hypothetical protein
MNTFSIRFLAPVMVISTAMVCGCSGQSMESVDSDSAELTNGDRDPGTEGGGRTIERTPVLERVDHAAYGEARSAAAKGAGITKWRLGVVKGDVLVDAISSTRVKGAAFQFRVSQDARGNVSITCQSGHALVLDAGGKLVSNTLDKSEVALFGAVADDFEETRLPEMEVAYMSFWSGLWKAARAALSCASVVITGGTNPIVDAQCIVGIGDLITSSIEN